MEKSRRASDVAKLAGQTVIASGAAYGAMHVAGDKEVGTSLALTLAAAGTILVVMCLTRSGVTHAVHLEDKTVKD